MDRRDELIEKLTPVQRDRIVARTLTAAVLFLAGVFAYIAGLTGSLLAEQNLAVGWGIASSLCLLSIWTRISIERIHPELPERRWGNSGQINALILAACLLSVL